MRILALETSGTSGTVAALDGDQLLVERALDPALRSARSLAPTIARVLREVDWKPADVQLVAVATGPGSFTGLRLGVMTAKAFAYAKGAQIQGVGTLECIAARVPEPASEMAVAIDAQRGEIYVARFWRDTRGALHAQCAAAIASADKWVERFGPGVVLSGPALEKFIDQLPLFATAAPRELWNPTAASVGRLAAFYRACGKSDDIWTLTPLYLRRSAAEEKWDNQPQ